jgi:hypothetical protein
MYAVQATEALLEMSAGVFDDNRLFIYSAIPAEDTTSQSLRADVGGLHCIHA